MRKKCIFLKDDTKVLLCFRELSSPLMVVRPSMVMQSSRVSWFYHGRRGQEAREVYPWELLCWNHWRWGRRRRNGWWYPGFLESLHRNWLGWGASVRLAVESRVIDVSKIDVWKQRAVEMHPRLKHQSAAYIGTYACVPAVFISSSHMCTTDHFNDNEKPLNDRPTV